MSFEFRDKITDHLKSILHTTYNELGIEAVIAFLKENGFSQLETVFILTSELNLSFNDANGFVLQSKSWK